MVVVESPQMETLKLASKIYVNYMLDSQTIVFSPCMEKWLRLKNGSQMIRMV